MNIGLTLELLSEMDVAPKKTPLCVSLDFTFCEVSTLWNMAELPSFFRVSGVTPDTRFSVRISTIVVIALTPENMSMRLLKRPLLAVAAVNGFIRFPLIISTKRLAGLATKLVCW